MPPTLSLWPFRYLVVLWVTMSAPNSIGRWMYGAGERVVDDEAARSCRCARSAAAAQIGQPHDRVGRRLDEAAGASFGVIARSTASRSEVST